MANTARIGSSISSFKSYYVPGADHASSLPGQGPHERLLASICPQGKDVEVFVKRTDQICFIACLINNYKRLCLVTLSC